MPAVSPKRYSPLHCHTMKSRRTPAQSQLSRLVRCFAFLLLQLTFSNVLSGAQERPTEQQVKSAYLYNFGKFVTWQARPGANSDSLQICVLGKDPFGPVLEATVAGESINGKKITVKRLVKIEDGPDCRILFISSSEQKRIRTILVVAQSRGMLTVSDLTNFLQEGGIIQFITQEDRIRFEVNLGAAEQSHLILSSQLLKVASRVTDAGTPQNQP